MSSCNNLDSAAMTSPASSSSSSSLPVSLPGNPAYASSAEEIEQNEDLLLQVLLKLPVKSLLRFICVSTKWCRIISNYSFKLSHSQSLRHPIPTSLVLLSGEDWIILPLEKYQDDSPGIRKLDFDYIDDDPGVTTKVVGSYAGLSLCHVASKYMDYFTYYVTNFTTKDFVNVPNMLRLLKHIAYKLVLAFDPMKAPDFSVLCVSKLNRDDDLVLEIYSSETRQWRKWQGSNFINPRNVIEVFDRGVFWNGAIHWLCPRGESFFFSMKDETMKVLLLPTFENKSLYMDGVRLMGQTGGHLHLVDVEFDIFRNHPIKIYRMEDNYGKWALIHNVNVEDVGSLFPEMVGEFLLDSAGFGDDEGFLQRGTYYSFAVLTVIWADDGSLDMILQIPHHIVSYNTKSRATKVLMKIEDYINMHDYKWYEVFQFSESFSWFLPEAAASPSQQVESWLAQQVDAYNAKFFI